jgi:F420-dependent oxidoreductase-like protein
MTAPPAVRFGCFLSQASHTWAEVLDDFRTAEDLGFDHAWIVDHFVDTDGPPYLPCLEAWTLLAALAARTSRIRLGVLVSSNTFRHPALLAKEAVTVDHVSNGRLILGIGTGWHEDEHRRYGIDLPPVGERVDRFEEAIVMIKGLTSQDRTTFQGRHYRLDDAPLSPRPVQARIPLLIAAHRPRMLRIAARYADQWDTFATLPGSATDGLETPVADRIRALDAACAEIGRDPAEIRRSTWAGPEVYASPTAFEDFVRAHRALGFTDFSIERPPDGRRDALERIARETIPALRAEFAAGR